MPDDQVVEAGNSKKFILIAEDDKFYGKIFKTKLDKEGYDVEVAEDGQKVLEIARSRKPDLVLLDLIMPIMDGFETLEEMKKDEKLKDVKVIVLSNLGQDSDKKRASDLGATDYLVKTNISIQEVAEKVRSYLGS